MSLGINTTTSEGMVLAADSRQSYRNHKNISRIGSDSASKVYRLGKRVGVIMAGLAFLQDQDGIQKNISHFLDEFKRIHEIEKMTIKEIGKKLEDFFEKKYPYHAQLEALPLQIKADLERQGCTNISFKKEKGHLTFSFIDPAGIEKSGMAAVDRLQFHLAGYNPDGSHQVLIVNVPGEVETKRDSTKKGQEFGASWIGQFDVVTRIVLGFDPRIGNLSFVHNAFSTQGQDVINQQLQQLEYAIQWGTMTLQDGIDFSVLLIQTTTAIQRFSDGIRGDPGDVPGVGGAVDVAVITPDKGFVWVSKKNLQVGGRSFDLESAPDLD